MDVMKAITKRRSVRNYQSREIEEEKLNLVLEAARLAPSAKNFQEWRFIVIRDKENRCKVKAAANNQMFIEQAPIVIVCCAETDSYVMRCGQLAYPIDLAIAIEHMVLEATEEGLGTCWIGSFYEDKMRAVLNIPAHIKVVGLLTLGYPVPEQPGKKSRLPLEDIVMYEKWTK
jgi:nitroreductase